MKRRTFVLWSGALGTISLSLSASSAAFSYDVSPLADFQIVPKEPDASLDVDNNTENVTTTHEWFVEPFSSTANIDTINIDYPSGTSFATVTDTDVTIEFLQSNGVRSVKFDGTYATSSADFNITDNNAEVLGEARVIIENDLENPNAGTYNPTITLTDVNANSVTLPAAMGISSGSANFGLSNFTPPSKVTVGDNIVFNYTLSNENSEFGSKTIEETTGGSLTERDVSLGGLESTELEHWGTNASNYTTSTSDTPEITVGAAIPNDVDPDESASQTVAVGGAFGLELTSYKQNQTADHTWSTGFLDSFEGEVDTIAFSYTSSGGGGGGGGGGGNGGGGNNKGFDFSNLTSSDVTVEIERSGDTGPTTIGLASVSGNGSDATISLDSAVATDIDGTVRIVLGGIKNPKDGDYQAEITLTSYDNYQHPDTVTFAITK